MNHDPYAPPQTAVNDIVAARGPRPRAVDIALILLAIVVAQLIWAGYVELTQLSDRKGPMTNAIFTLQAAKIVVAIGLWVAIARGLDWARLIWLFLVLFLFIIGARRLFTRCDSHRHLQTR